MSHIEVIEEHLPMTDIGPKELAYNFGLIDMYVSEQYRFKDIDAFAAFLETNACPSNIAIGKVFYEMEEYDARGVFISYASVMYERQIVVRWDRERNRYSGSPCVTSVTLGEQCSLRNDIHYLSQIPKEDE